MLVLLSALSRTSEEVSPLALATRSWPAAWSVSMENAPGPLKNKKKKKNKIRNRNGDF